MSWGKGIVVAFIFFTAFIGVLVVVCLRQDVSLVSSTYYEDDLNFQQQYNQTANANAIRRKPTIVAANTSLLLSYHNFYMLENGTLTIMRPSNNLLDHTFHVASQADTSKEFSIPNLSKGLYKVRFQWKEGGKEFRIDRTVVI